MKVRIKETGEIADVVSVGDNLFLDEKSKNIYNLEDFDVVQNIEECFQGEKFLKEMLEMNRKEKQDIFTKQIAKIDIMFRNQLILEIVRKRPFMRADKVVKKMNDIIN